MSKLLIKIALIEQLVGKDAPLASKVRAYLAMGTLHSNRKQVHETAMQAINLARAGFGWNTLIREYVDGPDSPFVEVTIGHIIDRYELIWFTDDSPSAAGAMS
jgi:hypothetical protein